VVTFDQVLMVGNGDDVTVGVPLVAGATVAGHLVNNKKQRTVIIQKKHRRQHFDRRNGHRQTLATVRIGEILIGGAATTLKADERLAAHAAKLQNSTAAIAQPVESKPAAKKAPAKKAAAKAEKTEAAPADEAAAKPAKKAPAKKAAAKKTEGDEKPAAKKAAKKAAPKADKE
jgi:large subunit ribosomal protein L21